MLATLRANLLATALGLLAAILLVVSVVQMVAIHGMHIGPIGWIGLKEKYSIALGKLNGARAELKAVSDAKDKQRAETSKRIGQSEKQRQISDRVARGIEEAPVAPDCRTPDTIMGADL